MPGIVTARASNGFYLQDPDPDTSAATSGAIFVFTSSPPAVAVGDSVNAQGTVQEFRPGGGSGASLTTTELANPESASRSSRRQRTAGGRRDQRRCAPRRLRSSRRRGWQRRDERVFDPASDGIDFWESLGAMRLRVNDAQATGPRNNFGEISLVTSGAGIRTPRGGIVIRANDYSRSG